MAFFVDLMIVANLLETDNLVCLKIFKLNRLSQFTLV